MKKINFPMHINWPEGLTKVSGQYGEICRVYVELFDKNDKVFGENQRNNSTVLMRWALQEW